jgi:hypothetical protein
MKSNRFSQEEYNHLLDAHNARLLGLSQSECELILMAAGATREQAKNGAYVYLHHRANIISYRRGSRGEYESILDDFKAKTKVSMDCIRHLEGLGFGYRQAQTAVYNYRKRHGLIEQSRY